MLNTARLSPGYFKDKCSMSICPYCGHDETTKRGPLPLAYQDKP
ncbi:MAG: hypothetical protein ACR2HF_04605 [Methylococcaceae bacterium]